MNKLVWWQDWLRGIISRTRAVPNQGKVQAKVWVVQAKVWVVQAKGK